MAATRVRRPYRLSPIVAYNRSRRAPMSSASQIEAAASAEWGILNALRLAHLRSATDLGSQHKTSAPQARDGVCAMPAHNN